MYRNGKINLFSKTLLLIAGSVYIFNYLLKGYLAEIFRFDPLAIVNSFEYWRFFTYPFATGTMEGVLLFALTFYVISPKLEDVLRKNYYPVLISLLIVFQSILFTLIYLFFGIDLAVSGMEGISLFVLTLYILLRPNEKVGFLNFPIVSTTVFSFIIFFVWAGLKYYNIFVNHAPVSEAAVGVAVFGIASGSLIYLQIRLIQKFIKKRLQHSHSDIRIPKQEEQLSFAMMSQSKVKKYYQEQDILNEDEDDILLSNDPEENEQMLNDILDKINIHGKESITLPEQKFLKEYSKTLQ